MMASSYEFSLLINIAIGTAAVGLTHASYVKVERSSAFASRMPMAWLVPLNTRDASVGTPTKRSSTVVASAEPGAPSTLAAASVAFVKR